MLISVIKRSRFGSKWHKPSMPTDAKQWELAMKKEAETAIMPCFPATSRGTSLMATLTAFHIYTVSPFTVI